MSIKRVSNLKIEGWKKVGANKYTLGNLILVSPYGNDTKVWKLYEGSFESPVKRFRNQVLAKIHCEALASR